MATIDKMCFLRERVLLVLILALLGVFGFSLISGIAIGADKPPIKIGVIYWQRGGVLSFGKRLFGGAHLAAKQINDKGGILGGRMIETLDYDEGFSAEEGVASVKKALADGCEAIVGFNDSTAGLAAQAYTREKGVILTTTGAGTRLLTKGSYPGYFRSGFMCQASDRARARWVEEMGYKTVVHLAVDSKYCIDALEDYRSVWDRPGSPVKLKAAIWVPYGANEMRLETTKAIGYRPDFIFTNTWGNDLIISMAQTIKELGFKNPWTICYDVMADDLVEALGPLGDGSWHAFNWLHDPSIPENEAFYQAYKKMHPDKEPCGFTESAYEGMWITALAIDAAGGTDNLTKYDKALMTVDWVTPRGQKVEILPNRESFHPVWSNAQLKGGKWTNKKPMKIIKTDYFVE